MEGKAYLKMNKDGAKRYPSLKKQGFAEFLKINNTIVESYNVISHPAKHTFAGYYDLQNVSPDGSKMFYLTVPRNASPKCNKASIYVYDINANVSIKIGCTTAWCWQQGCRLRWMPGSSSKLVYNDFVHGSYISRVIDIGSGTVADFAPTALYDIAFQSETGISLNFQRLQSLRPGYGYSRGKDRSKKLLAPADDGVFAVDLNSKSVRLLYSLKDLSEQVVSKSTDYHYINHISVSPDGKRFMFFHLWTKDSLDMWKMRLLVSNIDGSNLVELECEDIISHYSWIDSNRLMVTKVSNKEPCYIIYDLSTGDKEIIQNAKLINDGHPTFFENKKEFISDTYPLSNCIQTMFFSSIENDKYVPILEAFSDPRLYIEKRCDMHPRFDERNNMISVDSTFSGGLRKVILLKTKEGAFNGF